MSEENFGDDKRQILRINNTVHRPMHYWTPAVHELLRYLESVDFPYSPRILGADDEGREILSFIDGESGKDSWIKITSDEGLKKFAKLLRTYHDAIAGFRPNGNSEWAYAKAAPKPGDIMCHGDFGPWNIVWKGNDPIGIVDWDLVVPAKPEYDILYALEYSVPFRDDETTLKEHHFDEVPDRKHRIKVFLDAYSTPMINDITSKVAQMQRTVTGYEKQLAERGIQPQVDWVANGDLEVAKKRAEWTEANKSLFE